MAGFFWLAAVASTVAATSTVAADNESLVEQLRRQRMQRALGPRADAGTLAVPKLRPPPTLPSGLSLGVAGHAAYTDSDDVIASLMLRTGWRRGPLWVGGLLSWAFAPSELPIGDVRDFLGAVVWQNGALLLAAEACWGGPALRGCVELSAGPELIFASIDSDVLFRQRASVRASARMEARLRLRWGHGPLVPWAAVVGRYRRSAPVFDVQGVDEPVPIPVAAVALEVGVDWWPSARRDGEKK
ncbi:MAG: hypothetical protein AAFN74_06680 [Myxococcota bacterium]